MIYFPWDGVALLIKMPTEYRCNILLICYFYMPLEKSTKFYKDQEIPDLYLNIWHIFTEFLKCRHLLFIKACGIWMKIAYSVNNEYLNIFASARAQRNGVNEEQYIRKFCLMKMLNLSSLGEKYFTLYDKNLLTTWSKNSRVCVCVCVCVCAILFHVLRVEDDEVWS